MLLCIRLTQKEQSYIQKLPEKTELLHSISYNFIINGFWL